MIMNSHELKTDSEFFCLSWDGKKPMELRNNDRLFSVGDTVYLREILSYKECVKFVNGFSSSGRRTKNQKQNGLFYSGRMIRCNISGVYDNKEIEALKDGFVYLQLEYISRSRNYKKGGLAYDC